MTDYSIKRGPYGKPWITRDGMPLDWPEGEDKPLNGHLYERVSYLSDAADNKDNLAPYRQAQAVFGVVRDRSLAWQFRALAAEHDDPWTAAKQEVKSLLKLAEKVGGDERKSGIGSAIHRYCHLKDIRKEYTYDVVQLEPWLDVYEEAVLSRFDVLDDEVFIVCDDIENPGEPTDLRTAGNFDRLVRDKVTGEVMIADIKSGKDTNEYAMSPTIQVAEYAHGWRYDQRTGLRTPIHPELSLTKGLLIHLPFNGGGTPECCVYPLDLTEGWRLALMTSDLMLARKMRCYKRDVIARAKAPKEPKESDSE